MAAQEHLDRARPAVATSPPRGLHSLVAGMLGLAAVAVAIVLAAWVNQRALDSWRSIVHSIEIRERAERALGHLRDAETGQRGFLLTTRDEFLEPYESGKARIFSELDELTLLVGHSEAQRQRVDQIRTLTSTKLAMLEDAVSAVRAGDPAEALKLVSQEDGRRIMDEVRAAVAAIQAEEGATIDRRTELERQRRLGSLTGMVLALLVLAFAAWQQIRVGNRRNLSLAQINAELDRLVVERTRELEDEKLRVEALLNDVNHRVGNNLAMVSALLNVQARQSREPAVKHALAKAQARIQAIAAGQRRMRIDFKTDQIDARPYFEDLLAEIGRSLDGRPITLELVMADGIRLPGRDAVSYVVLVNELVTNAMKHAFPAGMTGRIVVSVEDPADGETALVLRVEDDGVGSPAEAEEASSGLGRTIVGSLLRSMRATMTVEPCREDPARPGTRVTLAFRTRSAA